MPNFDQDKVDKIRRLTIISMFAASDDLMELFALKGGNALNYIYNLNQRSSIDIDISMENSFEALNLKLEKVENILRKSFERTFKENSLKAFDIKLEKKPQRMDSDKEGFWGGYQLSFKALELDKWQELKEKEDITINDMSRQAIPFNREFKRKFTVDISRHEYLKERELKLLDDYYIYVYSPLMIVLEKLRAICQQTEEYTEIIETHKPRGRAQDFFDIYVILESFSEINLNSQKSIGNLKEIFKIKKVPISILDQIENYREFHRDSFTAVIDTVFKSDQLKDYDFYFDYVLDKVKSITENL
jgi:hypothetical protein